MTRYALYFMPHPADPLWRFGSSVIGYDAAVPADAPFPEHPAFDGAQIAAWTAEPRIYGFHATLKAPFELVEGASADELLAAIAAFASKRAAFRLASLQLKALGPFLALVPPSVSAALQSLADDCVRAFDRFRAPLSAADRERRLQSPLTKRQIAYLDEWGYPYVFEEFRFHMTLSGPLHEADRAQFAAALEELYAPIRAAAEGVTVDGIAVFRQAKRGDRFVVEERFAFGA